jgi:hypothetical protein
MFPQLIKKSKKIFEWADWGIEIPQWILEFLDWFGYAFDIAGKLFGHFFGLISALFSIIKHTSIYTNRFIDWYQAKYPLAQQKDRSTQQSDLSARQAQENVSTQQSNLSIQQPTICNCHKCSLLKPLETETTEQQEAKKNLEKVQQRLGTLIKVKAWAENFDLLGDVSLTVLVILTFSNTIIPGPGIIILGVIAGIFSLFKLATVTAEAVLKHKVHNATRRYYGLPPESIFKRIGDWFKEKLKRKIQPQPTVAPVVDPVVQQSTTDQVTANPNNNIPTTTAQLLTQMPTHQSTTPTPSTTPTSSTSSVSLLANNNNTLFVAPNKKTTDSSQAAFPTPSSTLSLQPIT